MIKCKCWIDNPRYGEFAYFCNGHYTVDSGELVDTSIFDWNSAELFTEYYDADNKEVYTGDIVRIEDSVYFVTNVMGTFSLVNEEEVLNLEEQCRTNKVYVVANVKGLAS